MKKLLAFAMLVGMAVVARPAAFGANTAVWESNKSHIDTTDLSNLGPYYWFANFANPNPVTNAATDSFEARNLPSWVHLETRHAFIGKDDSGLNNDDNPRTGYSFVENSIGTAGGATVGGQPNFNDLILPGGVSGRSGQVLEVQQGLNNTTTQLFLRILDGAPESFRIWVVTDNGAGTNFNIQNRIRVGLRDTDGPPGFLGDPDQVEAEAHPGGSGSRLIGQANSIPESNNGIADAWSFLLTGVNEHDVITVRPTGGAGFTNYAGFAGLIIQPVPEPSVALLAWIGGIPAVLRRRWGR
jgi:hypothetical protein